MAERRRHPEKPSRLARSYLVVRAEQYGEQQPGLELDEVRQSVRLPRLDSVHLSSPEANAQYRLGMLARMEVHGEAWFTLAELERPRR